MIWDVTNARLLMNGIASNAKKNWAVITRVQFAIPQMNR